MKGQELRAIRDRLRWTQAEFAKALGVAPNTVARWERDERRIQPPAEIAIRAIAAREKAR
jgi:transcriptional regulator with XRE-family HTH domain